MGDKHTTSDSKGILDMLVGAVNLININGVDMAQDEPVLHAFTLAQCASAAYLGQTAGTLSELLAMARAEEAEWEEAGARRRNRQDEHTSRVQDTHS